MAYINLTYETADQLAHINSEFKKYNKFLHITATNSLRRGVIQNNAELRWIEAPVITFGHILDNMDCFWFTSKTQLKQYTLISQYLREYTKNLDTSYKASIFNALEKNKNIVLRTIRTLEEADVTATEIKKIITSPSFEEQICLDVWTKLEETNSIQYFRRWFKKFKKDTYRTFKKIISSILLNSYGDNRERQLTNLPPTQFEDTTEIENYVDELLESKHIVLHGFYFITPIQQRLIDILEKAGFTIIHLINYRKGYPNTFKTIEEFLNFNVINPISITNYPPIINNVSNKFLEICEGYFETPGNLYGSQLFQFNHIYQFKQFIESESPNDFLISPRAREVRKNLEDLSNLQNLHLKDYPIGKFLIDIHQLNTAIFNENKRIFNDREELTITILKRIFASDYLHSNGKSSKSFVSDLEKIGERIEHTYTFNNNEISINTFDIWISALKKLIDDQQQSINALTPDIEKESISIDEKMYMYPILLLSYFSVSLENLKIILEFFNQIKSIYNMIFSGNQIDLNTYIMTLQEYLNEYIMPNILVEEEKEVAEQILVKFESLKDDEIETFDRRDLIQGLRFFLSENIENENANSLFSESFLDSRIVSLQDGDLLPFVDNEHVHLSFLDNKALPLVQNIVTWPFNNSSMEILYSKCGKYLSLIKKRKDLDSSITKYLIYLITQNAASIKFSSVANFNNEQNLKLSFYIELLDLPEGSMTSSNSSILDESNIEYIYKKINSLQRKKSNLLVNTKDFCNKRMVFSYMLQEFPTFETEFHQRFIFEKLLSRYEKMRKKNRNMTKEEMKQIIFDWFPHWSQTKKEILSKNAYKWKYLEPEYKFGRFTFFDDLTRLALFGSKPPKNNIFANKGPHCKYCPFQSYCKESVRQVDE